jgi:hypothetical protein
MTSSALPSRRFGTIGSIIGLLALIAAALPHWIMPMIFSAAARRSGDRRNRTSAEGPADRTRQGHRIPRNYKIDIASNSL